MKYKPHNYQLQAINFILANKACCLFLDCGLGKTVITLSALQILKARGHLKGRVLIIAPKRPALLTWPDELQKWDHLKKLTYDVCIGDAKKREAVLKSDADIIIINRENIKWLTDFYVKKDWPFKTVVLDELSGFKSYKSERTKALIRVRPQIDRIIGLTGTPASNGYMDIWAEFRIIDDGERLGKYITHYRQEYFRPGYSVGNIVYSWRLSDRSAMRINEKIKDITLSQKAMDFLDMPDLVNVLDKCKLDEIEQVDYDIFQMTSVYDLLGEKEVTAVSAGVLSGKLMQYASGSLYTDDKKETIYVHNKKYEVLEDLLEAQNGKPVLLCYWFQADKTKLCEFLDERKIKWTEIDDKKSQDTWNNKEIAVGLIHPAKAGHGLNLQRGGNSIIWFSMPPWNLELYQQTNARLYRQGQSESKVIVHHIITENTIDEHIYKALQNKNLTQENLLNWLKLQKQKI